MYNDDKIWGPKTIDDFDTEEQLEYEQKLETVERLLRGMLATAAAWEGEGAVGQCGRATAVLSNRFVAVTVHSWTVGGEWRVDGHSVDTYGLITPLAEFILAPPPEPGQIVDDTI